MAEVGAAPTPTGTVDLARVTADAVEEVRATAPHREVHLHVPDAPVAVVGDGRRQIQQFIFTSLPGAVGDTFQGSVNGGQYYSHEILIDGIPLGRMDLQGGSNNEFSPSAESISEFKLQTGTISAQYSGGQTAVANFVTKSGTNQLHGSAYYYVQNDALRANGWNNNAAGIARQSDLKCFRGNLAADFPVQLGRRDHLELVVGSDVHLRGARELPEHRLTLRRDPELDLLLPPLHLKMMTAVLFELFDS